MDGDQQPPSKKARIPSPASATASRSSASGSASSASDVPRASHYEVSYLHRSTVTRAVCSSKHGYVVTASEDGCVKFWKRLGATATASGDTSGGTGGSAAGGPPARCLEFVKSYTAHIGPVLALVVSQPDGDTAASVGKDGTIKLYDVGTFDVTGMIKTKKKAARGDQTDTTSIELGMHAAFLGEDQSLIAVASASTPSLADDSDSDDDDDGPAPQPSAGGLAATAPPKKDEGVGAIYVFSTVTLSPLPVRIVKLHASPVTALAYNAVHNCAISCDGKGVIELWNGSILAGGATGGGDGEGAGDEFASIGSSPVAARNGIDFQSKFSTSLYDLMKKKTFAVALAVSPTGTNFALYGADRKIRILDYATCNTVVTYDERPKVYDKMVQKRADKLARGESVDPSGIDAIEYGKRAATEREMDDTVIMSGGTETENVLMRDSGSQLLSLQFDPTGRYILIPTILGIKVINLRTNKCIATVGKADASALRFLSVCLCSGDARIDRQIQLARTGGSSAAIDHGSNKKSDALIVALAYKKRRLYVFSHSDPVAEAEMNGDDDEAVILNRDVMNEPPDADDMLVASGGRGESESKLGDEAILRTSMGDIHIRLFPNAVPRTIENFCGHAKSGYYDNVIFHRVIKGFMLQTGDPLGDGTGGESIWGGEFEDEFRKELRHDRPFTVSMANAGPGTNGSQFFITTVPTPWLDNKHTVFGRVTKGMDVCSAIESAQTDEMDKPLSEIRIMSVDIM